MLLEDKIDELESDLVNMIDKLELKENEVNEILESYETKIIERTNNVHNQLSVDIKKGEEKY